MFLVMSFGGFWDMLGNYCMAKYSPSPYSPNLQKVSVKIQIQEAGLQKSASKKNEGRPLG